MVCLRAGVGSEILIGFPRWLRLFSFLQPLPNDAGQPAVVGYLIDISIFSSRVSSWFSGATTYLSKTLPCFPGKLPSTTTT